MKKDSKVVLVTGSSRGIGRGIAVRAAEEGFSVAINYAGNMDAAEETRRLCSSVKKESSQEFEIFQGDIGDSSSREQLLAAVIERFGDFHALVNNAGVAPKERRDLLEMSEESLDRLLGINLKGGIFLSQAAARFWLSRPADQRGFRSLIFITSVSSEMVSLNRGEYCMTKAGLSMGAQLFARRLASENIGVYEVRPGIIQTDMTGGVKEKYDRLIADGLVPQRRWGTPDDIGRAVASLLNGSFGFSTGSVIQVDGGLHIPEL